MGKMENRNCNSKSLCFSFFKIISMSHGLRTAIFRVDPLIQFPNILRPKLIDLRWTIGLLLSLMNFANSTNHNPFRTFSLTISV